MSTGICQVTSSLIHKVSKLILAKAVVYTLSQQRSETASAGCESFYVLNSLYVTEDIEISILANLFLLFSPPFAQFANIWLLRWAVLLGPVNEARNSLRALWTIVPQVMNCAEQVEQRLTEIKTVKEFGLRQAAFNVIVEVSVYVKSSGWKF